MHACPTRSARNCTPALDLGRPASKVVRGHLTVLQVECCLCHRLCGDNTVNQLQHECCMRAFSPLLTIADHDAKALTQIWTKHAAWCSLGERACNQSSFANSTCLRKARSSNFTVDTQCSRSRKSHAQTWQQGAEPCGTWSFSIPASPNYYTVHKYKCQNLPPP